jgi:hypothetical protein
MAFWRKTSTRPTDQTIEYLRGVVARWAATVGDLRQVTMEREGDEDILCAVEFNDRPVFTVGLVFCVNAENYGIEAKLVAALNDVSTPDEEIWLSGLADEWAMEPPPS